MLHLVIGNIDDDLIREHFSCSCEWESSKDPAALRCEGCIPFPIKRSNILTMEELAVEAGFFASKNQARKNGFAGPIPTGINLLGTKKKKVWVWKI